MKYKHALGVLFCGRYIMKMYEITFDYVREGKRQWVEVTALMRVAGHTQEEARARLCKSIPTACITGIRELHPDVEVITLGRFEKRLKFRDSKPTAETYEAYRTMRLHSDKVPDHWRKFDVFYALAGDCPKSPTHKQPRVLRLDPTKPHSASNSFYGVKAEGNYRYSNPLNVPYLPKTGKIWKAKPPRTAPNTDRKVVRLKVPEWVSIMSNAMKGE